jgi:hypothetical protein
MFQKQVHLIVARDRGAYWISPAAPRSARATLNGLFDQHPEWGQVTRDEIQLDPDDAFVLFGYHLEESVPIFMVQARSTS